jgi:uncharacterized membrane protein YsdA (DUF1294 family)
MLFTAEEKWRVEEFKLLTQQVFSSFGFLVNESTWRRSCNK